MRTPSYSRCVCMCKGRYDGPLPLLCPCTVVWPTDQHAPLVWITIPGAHSSNMYCTHPLHPLRPPWPVSRLVTSCAYVVPPYTWHIQSTRTCIRHLLILKNPFCFYICVTAYRCPYGASALAVCTANNTARPASRFQCAFHQLTGLVTLSPELLNLGLNALRKHRGRNSRPCTVFCLCVCVCVFVKAKCRLRPWVHTACNHHEQSFMYTSPRDSICGRTVGVKG